MRHLTSLTISACFERGLAARRMQTGDPCRLALQEGARPVSQAELGVHGLAPAAELATVGREISSKFSLTTFGA